MSQTENFAAVLEWLTAHHPDAGVGAQPQTLTTADYPGGLVFSSQPGNGPVEPVYLLFKNIQEMKAIGGVSDHEYGADGMDEHHPLPAPFSAERLQGAEGSHADICAAFRAYIYGNSAQVKDYEAILNEKRFPMRVALYAGEDITVTANNPLIVEDKGNHGDPVVLTYRNVTVERGGRIIFKTNGAIRSEKMILAENSKEINIENRGGNGSDGASGRSGNDGALGVAGSSGVDNKNSCASQATSGTAGGHGTAGTDGAQGVNGGVAHDVSVVPGEVVGKIVVLSQGGDGGNGGNGGNGGGGGNGGSGGASTKQCGAGNGGDGGDGGKGGNGGNGGNGGDGGNVYITYTHSTETIKATALGGKGGSGGAAGAAGAAGSGGSGSTAGSSGKSGAAGNLGNSGQSGKAGKVFINGVPQI
jgi:hypothetical protein